MKLGKHDFARLIAKIQLYLSEEKPQLTSFDVEDIDNIIDFDVPQPEVGKSDAAVVDAMLKAIADGRKIDSIKAYRTLTGLGLKESKDAIEAYWLRQPAPAKPGVKTMLDCIDTHIESVGTTDANPYFLLNGLSKNDIAAVRSFVQSFDS